MPLTRGRPSFGSPPLDQPLELARSHVLGALLNLVVHGLRTLPGFSLDRLPRMADFAIWAAACEPALWRPGTSTAPMRQTAGPRSTALSMLIRSPLVCGRSWPSAARG